MAINEYTILRGTKKELIEYFKGLNIVSEQEVEDAYSNWKNIIGTHGERSQELMKSWEELALNYATGHKTIGPSINNQLSAIEVSPLGLGCVFYLHKNIIVNETPTPEISFVLKKIYIHIVADDQIMEKCLEAIVLNTKKCPPSIQISQEDIQDAMFLTDNDLLNDVKNVTTTMEIVSSK